MNDYLDNIVGRTLQLAPVVRPRVPSLFEPLSAAAGVAPTHEDETLPVAGSEVFDLIKAAGRGPREPAKSDSGSQRSGAVESAPGKEFGSSGNVAPQPDQFGLSSRQILSPVLAQTKTSAVSPVGPLLSTAEMHGDQSVLELPVTASGFDTPSKAFKIATRRIAKANLADESTLGERRELIEATAQRALASRLARSALRRDSAQLQAPNDDAAPETPTISVTIGRIDVRAIYPQPQTQQAARRVHSGPMSLDEYLKQRSGGRK